MNFITARDGKARRRARFNQPIRANKHTDMTEKETKLADALLNKIKSAVDGDDKGTTTDLAHAYAALMSGAKDRAWAETPTTPTQPTQAAEQTAGATS